MGLAALLSKVLDHKPRYVTLDGQIVAHSVTSDGNGWRHPELGRVSRVEPHRFHGTVPLPATPTNNRGGRAALNC